MKIAVVGFQASASSLHQWSLKAPLKHVHEQGEIPYKELVFSVCVAFFTAQYLQWRKGDASIAASVYEVSIQYYTGRT